MYSVGRARTRLEEDHLPQLLKAPAKLDVRCIVVRIGAPGAAESPMGWGEGPEGRAHKKVKVHAGARPVEQQQKHVQPAGGSLGLGRAGSPLLAIVSVDAGGQTE